MSDTSNDYWIEGSGCTTTYITVDTTTSSTSEFTMMWWNGTNWEFSQEDPLERMKQDFEALAHGFFLEKFDVPFEDRRCPPAFNLL